MPSCVRKVVIHEPERWRQAAGSCRSGGVLYWPKDNDASQSAFVDAARAYFLAHPEVLAPMCKALDAQSRRNVAEREERVTP
ncbi:hypothetical protein D3C77_570000 [compost metagenome]